MKSAFLWERAAKKVGSESIAGRNGNGQSDPEIWQTLGTESGLAFTLHAALFHRLLTSLNTGAFPLSARFVFLS